MLYTPQQAAEYMAVSRSHVYRLLARGEIEVVRISGCLRIDETDLKRFIQACKQPQTPQVPCPEKRHF
ncbi:MAG: helix-turn-helix domain-containing protein [Planctomycetaceae bacterium]|nr:helix-turn-helix domain-containing protein [Planctomycetaceae bacterium]